MKRNRKDVVLIENIAVSKNHKDNRNNARCINLTHIEEGIYDIILIPKGDSE